LEAPRPGSRVGLRGYVDRMIDDALQDMAQIEFRVDMVEFGRAEQAVMAAARSPPASDPAKR
jgi:hypothetical protein